MSDDITVKVEDLQIDDELSDGEYVIAVNAGDSGDVAYEVQHPDGSVQGLTAERGTSLIVKRGDEIAAVHRQAEAFRQPEPDPEPEAEEPAES